MDSPKRYRFVAVGFGILVVLNLGLMAIIWYDHPSTRRPSPPDGGPKERDFVFRELGFSETQMAQARAMQNSQRIRGDSIRLETYKVEVELIEELFRETPDSARIRLLVESAGQMKTGFDIVLFEHFRDLKAICTPEQQVRLKELLLDFAIRAKGPGGPHDAANPPGPPRHPPSGDRNNPPPPPH